MNTTFPTDEARWQAVVERNREAAGHFWLGVRSTGIFCRPGCPARTPLRKNVVFFDSVRDALRSGLRPCKRCRPLGSSLGDDRIRVIVQACQELMESPAPLSLEELAERYGMSASHFQKVFTEVVGISPAQFSRSVRAERIQQQLPIAESVTRAAGDAGFTSSAQFYAEAPNTLGMAPGRFRDKGKGESIRFAITSTWLGLMLIAATDRGICRIQFGEDADAMRDRLLADFANATILEPDPDFDLLVQQTVESIGSEATSKLPLDIRGTAFQAKVWNALRRIPYGSTVTYGELAREIGQPTASRAVASVCGSNDIAVLIPCHRVIGKDGSLTGYRWGVQRKKELLAREQSGGDVIGDPERTIR